MPRAKGSKTVKFTSGIGLEMYQMLLDILERNLDMSGKGAGSTAKQAAVEQVLKAFEHRKEAKFYTYAKLRKALSDACIRVSKGRPTGNVQFTMEEARTYALFREWNTESFSSEDDVGADVGADVGCSSSGTLRQKAMPLDEMPSTPLTSTSPVTIEEEGVSGNKKKRKHTMTTIREERRKKQKEKAPGTPGSVQRLIHTILQSQEKRAQEGCGSASHHYLPLHGSMMLYCCRCGAVKKITTE